MACRRSECTICMLVGETHEVMLAEALVELSGPALVGFCLEGRLAGSGGISPNPFGRWKALPRR